MKREKNEGKPMDQTYDMIVIGLGEESQSAVQALHAQGKKVKYIALSRDMIATMVCHHPQNPSTSHKYHDENHTHTMSSKKIHLHEQSLDTPVSKTVTYTFHVEEVAEEEEVVDFTTVPYQAFSNTEESTESDTSFSYMTWPEEVEGVEEVEEVEEIEEVVASNKEEIHPDMTESPISETINPQARPININMNNILGHFNNSDFNITGADEVEEVEADSIQEIEEPKTSYFSFFQEPHQEEEKEENISDQHQEEEMHKEIPQKLKPSSLSRQQAEEISSREQLLSRKENKSTHFFTSFNPDPPVENEQKTNQSNEDEAIDRSSFLHSVLNKPVYSPRESRLRKRPNLKSKQQTELIQKQEQHSQQLMPAPETIASNEQESPIPPPPRVQAVPKAHSIEPFSTRRRARVQKKSRMMSTAERFQDPLPDFQEESPSLKSKVESTNLDQQPFFHQPIYQEPEIEEQQVKHEAEMMENAYEEDDQGNDTLKRDTIEFEEPYGYNSWEEFMYPSSQNNRKRQEIDEIKKRKIALRGLHNLINDLG